MTERFKRYLEEKFRAVSPTKEAKEYRIRTLKRLEEYAQDLRIKGMDDEDLIFCAAVDSLGDFDAELAAFESDFEGTKKVKHTKSYILGGVCAYTALLVVTYVLLGAIGGFWHPGWLVPVCGLLLGGAAGAIAGAVILFIKKKPLFARVLVAGALVLGMVSLYLLIEILGKDMVPLDWYVFLVMVCVVLLSDSVIAWVTKSKVAFWETILAFLVTISLLYVMIGIALPLFWHPGWVMILLAVVAAAAAVGIRKVLEQNKKMKERRKHFLERREGIDEKYYTEW